MNDEGQTFSEPQTIVSNEDVAKALKRLRNKKSAAEDGLVAEMLITGHEGLINAIAAFLTNIVNGSLEPPEDLKRVKLTLVLKSADPRMPKNYYPISVVPVMVKKPVPSCMRRSVPLSMRSWTRNSSVSVAAGSVQTRSALCTWWWRSLRNGRKNSG